MEIRRHALIACAACALASVAHAALRAYPLDERSVYAIRIGRDEPTTCVFPGPSTALEGAGVAVKADDTPAVLLSYQTLRAITMAEVVDVPLYVVHVSAAQAAEAIGAARRRGVKVVGETLPGFLAIDDSVYASADFDEAAGHVMSPPYRPLGHQEALWKALETGALGVTGTDHCCFTRAQKRLGLELFTRIPNGCGGVEDRMHVLWHLGVNGGRLTPERFVSLTSATAAKVFNLWPRKGSLQVGADGDVVVIDPAKTKTLSARTQHQNTDFSVWEGREVKGVVVHTLARGRRVWVDGDLRTEPGWGRYLPRKPFGAVYGGVV